MDPFDRSDIELALGRLDEILGSRIFERSASNVFFRSAFIETLIALRDLMYKAEKYSARISFTDDVQITSHVKDVTGLIKYVRDALCHPDSDNHYVEVGKVKATFNVLYGAGCLVRHRDFEQSSPYPDDVCFFFGSQRIFLRRHILRAYEEAKNKLLPLTKQS